MKTFRIAICGSILLLGSYAAQAQSIDLASSTADWRPILFAYGNYVDPLADQQTGLSQGDIVGDLSNPGAFWQFSGMGTPSATDGELAFRLRMEKAGTASQFTYYALAGIDGNLDGSMDYFVSASEATNKGGINIWATTGTGNTSPNNTAISNTAYYNEAINATNYNYSAVSTIDSGAPNFGADANYFISYKVPFQQIVNAFAAKSISITESSALRFVMATTTQMNALNVDIGGISGGISSTTTYSSLGVITSPLTSTGNDPLLWLGNFSTVWSNSNITTNKNWTSNASGLPAGSLDDLSFRMDFADTRGVTFDDRATNYDQYAGSETIVNITTNNVAPASVYINNSTLNYVFQTSGGEYGIKGTNSVVKVGTGIATFKNTNTYSGGTSLTGGGTISIHRGDSLGSAGIAVGTGTLDFAGTSSYTLANTILDDTAMTMSVTNASPVTVSGAIGGAGTLTKTGSGRLILTGSNAYGGATTISSGTLQIGDGGTAGTLGTSTSAISNSGTLAVNRSDTVGLSVAVTGTGGLTQMGAGVLGLTATNTYSGVTSIQAGALMVGNGGTVGTLGTGDVQNAAELGFNRSNTMTVANNISGTGMVTQVGTGTTILTGTNTYSGATTIQYGAIQVGNGGTAGTLGSGDVANSSVLAFNRSDIVTFGNKVSGAGALIQGGTGTTILTGGNDYSGATYINAGTLQVGNGGATGNLGSGAVTNNTALVFNRSNNHTVANNISGTGTLTQRGTGRTILTGSSGYSGITTVENGELAVNGSISGSDVTVQSGALLSGSGSVGAVSGAGTVSPGNSPGILEAVSVDPTEGTDFNFEFTQTGSPTYSNATASGNDVLRLTGGAPFAAPMTSANTVNIYLNLQSLAGNETFLGAWYTDQPTAFDSSLASAHFVFWIKGDGSGTELFNGVNYLALASVYPMITFNVSTVADTADYSSDTVYGYVTQFSTNAAIPEPTAAATLMMALAAYALRRRIRG